MDARTQAKEDRGGSRNETRKTASDMPRKMRLTHAHTKFTAPRTRARVRTHTHTYTYTKRETNLALLAVVDGLKYHLFLEFSSMLGKR
jgi:hypothetical protein